MNIYNCDTILMPYIYPALICIVNDLPGFILWISLIYSSWTGQKRNYRDCNLLFYSYLFLSCFEKEFCQTRLFCSHKILLWLQGNSSQKNYFGPNPESWSVSIDIHNIPLNSVEFNMKMKVLLIQCEEKSISHRFPR